MYGPIHEQARTQPQFSRSGVLSRINFRQAGTADVRALLSELKELPYGHRWLLCKLLKRVASQAPGKASVVHLADSHPKMKF
jgi:uncharacterized protein (DUF1800 family)